jgi:hypothetical protein
MSADVLEVRAASIRAMIALLMEAAYFKDSRMLHTTCFFFSFFIASSLSSLPLFSPLLQVSVLSPSC